MISKRSESRQTRVYRPADGYLPGRRGHDVRPGEGEQRAAVFLFATSLCSCIHWHEESSRGWPGSWLSVWGGCPEDPLHPDTIWKAVHGVETLYTIMGPGCVSVTRASTPDTELVTGVWKDGKIGTYRGIRKGAVTYRAMVFGEKGISPSGDYGYDVPTKWVARMASTWATKGWLSKSQNSCARDSRR